MTTNPKWGLRPNQSPLRRKLRVSDSSSISMPRQSGNSAIPCKEGSGKSGSSLQSFDQDKHSFWKNHQFYQGFLWRSNYILGLMYSQNDQRKIEVTHKETGTETSLSGSRTDESLLHENIWETQITRANRVTALQVRQEQSLTVSTKCEQYCQRGHPESYSESKSFDPPHGEFLSHAAGSPRCGAQSLPTSVSQ